MHTLYGRSNSLPQFYRIALVGSITWCQRSERQATRVAELPVTTAPLHFVNFVCVNHIDWKL